MLEGKGAQQHFSACIDFMGLVRDGGHRGLCISQYGFDRAICSAMQRLLTQRHEVHYQSGIYSHGQGSDMDIRQAFLAELDWCIVTPCFCHDSHNALQWALKTVFPEYEAHTKSLWIVITSLRNSYGMIHKHLREWLSSALVVEEWDVPTNVQYAFLGFSWCQFRSGHPFFRVGSQILRGEAQGA